MVRTGNLVLVPLDGSVIVSYTRGGSVAVNDGAVFGRFSYEAGHPLCNPKGLCIAIQAN